MQRQAPLPEFKGTKAERRQRENAVAIGGLRDPRRAVARSCTLRQTGAKIRNVINEFLSDELIASFDNANGVCPFSSELLMAARQKLARVFGAEPNAEGYQTNLFKQILFEADDPDRNTIPDWLEFGFPLGINEQIVNNGIFPDRNRQCVSLHQSVPNSRHFA